jgi:hypothetical protein
VASVRFRMATGEITRRCAPRPLGAALRAFNLAEDGQVPFRYTRAELTLFVCREFEF